MCAQICCEAMHAHRREGGGGASPKREVDAKPGNRHRTRSEISRLSLRRCHDARRCKVHSPSYPTVSSTSHSHHRIAHDIHAHPTVSTLSSHASCLRHTQHKHPSHQHRSQKVHIPPKSILLVNKLRTKPVVDAISAILSYVRFLFIAILVIPAHIDAYSYLKEQHPQVRVFHEDRKDRPGGVEPWRPGTRALHPTTPYT